MKLARRLVRLFLAAGLCCADAGAGGLPSEVSEPIQPLPETVNVDWKRAALGRVLFFDKRLSHDNTVSCASCHSSDHGGADSRARSIGARGVLASVNAPTVWNSAYNFRQFWGGSAGTLEEQVGQVIALPTVMGSSWTEVLGKLGRDRALSARFAATYPDGLSAAAVENAIATYERTLVTPDSPFDRYLRGDPDAISQGAKDGYRLFKQKGCISCHQGMNVGGNLFEVFGVMADYFADRGGVTSADYGRYNYTHQAADKFVFKVPGLRNVELTAPYFHDGSAATLQDAVRVMAQYQLGERLSEADTEAIVAFLRTLTGHLQGRPR